MKAAIVGSGIAGLAAAAELHDRGCDVTVFESRDEIGGHVRTIPVDVGDRSIPVELGVFMHDPRLIHPRMGELAKRLHSETHSFPLTFAYDHQESDLHWGLLSKTWGWTRDLSVFFKLCARGLFEGKALRNARYLMEIKRFVDHWPTICTDSRYREMSVADYVKEEKFSELFLETWMLPQLQCWWGAEREPALNSSIQVVADSFYRVSRAPQYIFNQGWQSFVEALANPYKDKIRLGHAVERVKRNPDGVQVIVDGQSHSFDHVIFATPPNVACDLLDSPSQDESRQLQRFETCKTHMFLHRDPRWMPRERELWAVVNLVQDPRGSIATLWFGDLFPDEPPVFVSWGEGLSEAPKDIIVEDRMLRTLPTIDYTHACQDIHQIQGQGNVWYCGAHVHALGDDIPSLWHENALLSGLNVAKRILA